MARVLHDWLTSFQELPIEGVGLLRWQRMPAQRIARANALQAPGWSLTFQPDAGINLPVDFFDRLSAFGQSSVSASQQQYQQWLRQFQGGSTSVELWGLGSLSKDSEDKWSGNFMQLPAGPDADLKRLPLLKKYLYMKWRWSDWFGLMLLIIALGWLVWAAVQVDFHWGIGPFKSMWKVQPSINAAPSYREFP